MSENDLPIFSLAESQIAMGPKDVIKQALRYQRLHSQELRKRPRRRRPAAETDQRNAPNRASTRSLDLGRQMLVDLVQAGASPKLPDGFKEAHDLKNKELTDLNFLTKDKYLELLATQRAATLSVLDQISRL